MLRNFNYCYYILFIFLININCLAQDKQPVYEYAIVTNKMGHHIKVQYSDGTIENINQIGNIRIKSTQFGDSAETAAVIFAFNYMEKKGYELVSSHAINFNYYFLQYIFRRRKL